MSGQDVTSDVEGGCPETVIHNFCHQELDCDFSCQILKMVGSIYLWVGGNGENNHNMLNFVTSCKSRYDDSRPLTAAIMNGSFEARADGRTDGTKNEVVLSCRPLGRCWVVHRVHAPSPTLVHTTYQPP